MSIQQVGQVQVVKPSDEVVNQFATLEQTTLDRPVSPARLEYHRQQLARGRFLHPPTWASVYCRHNGKRYRVNGKHTSLVLREVPYAARPAVTLVHYECDTPDEVADLFNTFDTRETTRTVTDVNRAVFNANDALKGYPVRLANGMTSGVCIVKAVKTEWAEGRQVDFNKLTRATNAAERARAVAEYTGTALWVRDNLNTLKTVIFERAAVLAAVILTREASQQEAEGFWLAVRDGTDPNPKAPTRVLRDYLLATRVAAGAAGRGRTASQREMLTKCLKAWNAARTGEELLLRYYEQSLMPKPL